MINLIKQIRNFKANNNVAPNEKIDIYLSGLKFNFSPYQAIIKRIAFVNNVTLEEPQEILPFIVNDGSKMSFKVLIDVVELKRQLEAEMLKLQGELSRSEAMLNNASFLAKAPAAKVKAEQDKFDNYRKAFEEISAKLANLV